MALFSLFGQTPPLFKMRKIVEKLVLLCLAACIVCHLLLGRL